MAAVVAGSALGIGVSVREPREWPVDAPEIKSPKVTLFVVVDGRPLWAATVGEKRDLIEETEGMPLWGTWRGEYATHVFAIDRGQAELEVCAGRDGSRRADPQADALLIWFAEEKGRQRLTDDHVSRRTTEFTAARWLLDRVCTDPGGKLKFKSVVQWALTDERRPFGWRGNLKTVASLRQHWDQLVTEWGKDGAPVYDPEYRFEMEGV